MSKYTLHSIEVKDNGNLYLTTVRFLGHVEDCADEIPIEIEEDYEEELATYRDAVRAREAYEEEGKSLWEQR